MVEVLGLVHQGDSMTQANWICRWCNKALFVAVGDRDEHEVWCSKNGAEIFTPDFPPGKKSVWEGRDFHKKTPAPTPEETILDEAKRLIYGDREQEYNHPKVDFERIAILWRAYFLAKGEGVVNLGAPDVAKMMVLLKLSRLTNSYHHDSTVDGAGYFGCLARLEEE